jgi:uncharacterized membrane protein
MPTRNHALAILAALSLFSVLQHAWYWPQLPDRIATHFGIDGQPNDWMSKTSATILLLGVQVGLPLFLIAIGSLVRWLPDSMINIPNREFWLHPDRRSTSLAWTNNMLAWIAVLSSLFMIIIGHLTFVANKNDTPLHTGAFLTSLAVYLATVFSIAGLALRRYRLPKSTAEGING